MAIILRICLIGIMASVMSTFFNSFYSEGSLTHTSQMDMRVQIKQVHEAAEEFTNCMNNFKIPYKGSCDLVKLKEEVERLKKKYGQEQDPREMMSRSVKVTFAERTVLAKLECRMNLSCIGSICDCNHGLSCDASGDETRARAGTRDLSLNCETAHDNLIRRLGKAKKNQVRLERRNFSFRQAVAENNTDKTTASPTPEDYGYEYYDVEEYERITKREENARTQRERALIEANIVWYYCLQNVSIQHNGPCNISEFYRQDARHSMLLSEAGGDIGLIPVSSFLTLARVSCLDPSECLEEKCTCPDPRDDCSPKPQNYGWTCESEFLGYLRALSATNRPVTLPDGTNLLGINANSTASYSLRQKYYPYNPNDGILFLAVMCVLFF